MKRIRNVFGGGVAALVMGTCGAVAVAQVSAGTGAWHRELAPAMTEARESGKVILAYFADGKSEVSRRGWANLSDGRMGPLLRTSCVPLLVDCEAQKSLAGQLGIREAGVAVLYDSKGTPVRMVPAGELNDPRGLEQLLRSIPAPGRMPALAAGVSGGGTVQAPGGGAGIAGGTEPAPTPTPRGTEATPAEAGDPFVGAMAADQVGREMLGRDVTITGTVAVFESSAGPRFPFMLTLTQRPVDPVQVVYWEQVARLIHAGGKMPGKGTRVSVKGKLTDFRGRLQIKVTDIRQIRIQ